MTGRAAGDGDQIAADGGRRALAWRRPARAPATRTRLQAMAAMASQAAFALNFPIWQVGQRAVVEVGEELLDDGVAAVQLLGLDEPRTGSR